MKNFKNKKAFTLIELLVTISIIGILSAAILMSTNGARKKSRDAQRILEVSQVQLALEAYYDKYGKYPEPDRLGYGGWDVGNADSEFIPQLATFMGYKLPRDLTKTGDRDGYFYYRYPAGTNGCDPNKAFYVLGTTLEGSSFKSNVTKSNVSPGWKCPTRNWQLEMGWVTGKYE